MYLRMLEKPLITSPKDEGLIRPVKRKTDPDIGLDVVMVMIRTDLDYLLSLTGSGGTMQYDMGVFHLYRTKSENGAVRFLSGPFLGAPHAVMGMEKLIALGARRIWVMGWCGSLQPDLRIGGLVIPTGALSEEGTSLHYPIGDPEPAVEDELNQLIENALQGTGRPYKKGRVWTTDAPYRETPEKVLAFQKKGVLAVEMEMSALMTLARYRRVKLGGLLVVSDELFHLKWRPGFSSPDLTRSSRFAGELLLQAANLKTDRPDTKGDADR
jgi:nucleoside phosphorylase